MKRYLVITKNNSTTAVLRPANAALSLRINFSWTLAGHIVYAGCQWSMLIALARLGSMDMVGRFALGLAVTAPIVMFCNLQLRSVQATDALFKRPFGDYLGLRIVTTLVAFGAIVLVAAVAGYAREGVMVIIALGAAKSFEAISDIFYGLQQQNERMDRMAVSLMLRGVLSLAALTLVVYLTGSVFWGCVSIAAVWALVLITYDTYCAKLILQEAAEPGVEHIRVRPNWDRRRLGSLALLALPLGIAMLLISLNANIPRYIIERYLGEAQLGIFAAMTYMMVAGVTVVSALANSAVPRLAKLYASGNASAFASLLIKLSAFGALTGGLGVTIAVFGGEWLLNALYGPECARYSEVFVLVAIASIASLTQWFLSNGMTAARYFRVQVPLYASVTAITIGCCMWLIPAYGLLGAGAALVIAETVLAAATLCIDVWAVVKLRKQQPN